MEYRNRKIIITGAASGFGSFLADYLKDKADMLFLIDINRDGLQKFNGLSNINLFQCDLTDYEETTKVIKEIYETSPDTNVLINNAGIIHSELLINFFNRQDRRHSKENWDKMLNVNLTSVFNCSVNVVDNMVRNKIKGLIINVSSISANGNSGQSVYSAAKAGVNALTIAWSRELSLFGIRAAGIAPGFFDTPSTHGALKESTVKKIISEIPSGRLGQLEELAKAVEFIIENDYFNGKILEIDGGMVLSNG
ncbi:MAG: SDR family NAD(P)-dependent oxidoreductase [Bacteroidales bacterium]|jgi:3-oxoacyl-[acyl-carrier protein] reductase|nr:SDR family NAD(P)-dependent oxidoreductase [Bacteroidales bacterium]